MTFLRFLLLSLAIVSAVSPALADAAKLAALEDRLERRFDDVVHLTLDELALMQIDARAAPILIDVRPEREFAVSHLEGAIRIAPNATAKEVEDALEVIAVGRPVVFYCSVGYRSSRLAERYPRAFV